MKTYITKRKDGKYTIVKETTFQSIVSDMAYLAVIVGSITMAILFNRIVGKSFLIDFFAVLTIILWFAMSVKRVKHKTINKDELMKELDEQLK